jgi:hypothetical protein
MKKLLLVLCAVGLIAAFSMPAVAADVKVFGDYYVYGGWESNHSLKANDPSDAKTSSDAVGQRLRINTVFQVAEGLKLTTRFDAMERIWGQDNVAPAPGILDRSEKNISWERAYVTFNLGPGFFDVGYHTSGNWSPIAFGNSTSSAPGVRYTSAVGPVTLSAYWMKSTENTTPLGNGAIVIFTASDAAAGTSASTTTGSTYAYSSGDRDNYAVEGTFKWKSGQAGLKVLYVADERNSGQYGWIAEDTGGPVVTYAAASVRYWEFSPFFQAKFGPVDLEAKLYYDYGKADYRLASATDVDIRGLSYYANGKVNIGPAYIGAMYAYMQGDNNPSDATLKYGHNGGQDWDPCLIIGNDRYFKWMGGLYKFAPKGYATASAFPAWYAEQNAKFIQGYVGVNPIPTLALKASFTNARQDYHTYGVSASKEIGNELDITATYKIYPNLAYMIGFGYWWVGDYFQGSSSANQLDNNYLLMHQLTLTF